MLWPVWAALCAHAGVVRGALPRPQTVRVAPERRDDLRQTVLDIKVMDSIPDDEVDRMMTGVLRGARPLFPTALGAPVPATGHQLADLRRWFRLVVDTEALALQRGAALLADPRIETATPALRPMPPPGDLQPPTPDLEPHQLWRADSPGGLGLDRAQLWPGGDGGLVTIADVEYSWEPDHEDYAAGLDALIWGWDSATYAYHGTAVLGILAALDNGYGVTGVAPAATLVVVSPYASPGDYNPAAAIEASAALLQPGDVLLIEQQASFMGRFAPLSVDDAVFDAISHAVAQGIVVVEPSGNGGQDLDDPSFEGRFDRTVRDSGSIMVGGGTPAGWDEPRAWVDGGSCHGGRVDLQGWYFGVATTANGEAGVDADLFFPSDDPRQGYTSAFSGTSAAAPQIAGVAAVVQSVALTMSGEPWSPLALRAALVATGSPQSPEDTVHIGPQPDLRRFLDTHGLR